MTIRTHTNDERKPEKVHPTTHKGGPKKKETKTNDTHMRQNERVGDMARETGEITTRKKARTTISILQIR